MPCSKAGADPIRAGDNPLTAIYVAVITGNSDILMALIDGRQFNNYDISDLHAAVKNGELGMVKLLLKAGAGPLLGGESDITALDIANSIYNADIIAALNTAVNPEVDFDRTSS